METRLNKDRCPGDAFISVVSVGGGAPSVVAFLVVSSESISSGGRGIVLVLLVLILCPTCVGGEE